MSLLSLIKTNQNVTVQLPDKPWREKPARAAGIEAWGGGHLLDELRLQRGSAVEKA
jgi:hypothetical protein